MQTTSRARSELWPQVCHSRALCGLCVSLFPSAENNSSIKALKCHREGAAAFPEGADTEEGIKRSLLHAHKALGDGVCCPWRARAGQEMRHSIHRERRTRGEIKNEISRNTSKGMADEVRQGELSLKRGTGTALTGSENSIYY